MDTVTPGGDGRPEDEDAGQGDRRGACVHVV